ncbi:MAG: hypothetical protein DBY08_02240 [Clostridiales bacterium]|nr:hypothetical protein [Bacillota bacterium]PWL94674.1 MAG: hypothetical protein DBY08_02240 [Clostridiales bacterium]
MKTIKYIMLLLLATAILCGCESQSKKQNDFSGTMENIEYPTEHGQIIDIMYTENEDIYISMKSPDTDPSKSIASVWKKPVDDDGWTQVYMQEFISDEEDKTVGGYIYFMDKGAVIEEMFFGETDISVNRYYTNTFGTKELEILPLQEQIGFVYYMDSLTEDKVVMEDSNTSTVKILNLNNNTIKELTEIDTCFFAYYDGRYVYMAHTEPFELSEEDEKDLQSGSITDNPSKYARGTIYDTENESFKQSDVLTEASVLLFEKWKGGKINNYNLKPAFCKDIYSDSEVYYVAHNDGIYRVDEKERKLIYSDEEWDNAKSSIDLIMPTPAGDIYIYASIFDKKSRSYTEKLMKITP